MKFTPSKISLSVIAVIMLWVSSNLNFGKDHWRGIVESDAKGYYAYLPAAFIYNDLNFNFFDSIEKVKYYDEHYYYDYRAYHNNKTIDKYYCGTAVMEMPFFLAAHVVTKCSSLPADGFSKYYCLSVNIAAVFYLLSGLYFLGKLLSLYKISEWNKAITFFAVVFGTNLFYYTVVEPGMSHVYSFALTSCFLFQAKKMFLEFSVKRYFYAAILLGLIFLIRPVNILIVLALPFVAGNKEAFFAFFQNVIKNIKTAAAAKLIMLLIVSIQFIIYKISCGSFFVYSYAGEGFDFSSPHLIDILFSYRKGLFLYTPLYLFSLLGLYFVFKRSKWEFSFFGFYFLTLTYILSCWHSWWYGGSFSSRVYIEYLPLFALSFAFLLNGTKALPKKIIISISFLLIIFCQMQTYQYRYDQIHWDGMTKEKYWSNFLRVDKII